MTLLGMATLDGNNEILPLAMSLVPSKTKESWTYFLGGISPFFPGLAMAEAVVISDRDKGLKHAVRAKFPNAIHASCCQHLAKNVSDRWPSCRQEFWKAAFAITEQKFKAVIDEIREHHPTCATYIEAILRDSWTQYAFPSPQYGQLTSNMQESQNTR